MSLFRWYSSWSIRWKLQFGFFLVTMITTIFNRWLASIELADMIDIAKNNAVSQEIVQQLQDNRSAYIFNSFWESGIEFAIQFLVIGIVASLFVKPIRALCDALQSVEEGDLTKGVENTSLDEIGVLARSFNKMLGGLNQIMGMIGLSGKEIGQSAYQIASISNDIADVSKNEKQRSDEVTLATSALLDISQSVQQLATEAMDQSSEAEQQAKQGIQTLQTNIEIMQRTAQDVGRAAEEISDLDASAEKIHNIISTISSIAEQTSLLSLNAAIEAARAGEQGRGFAVVADEVRNLANNTTKSVAEIAEIIETLTGRVQQVTSTMGTVVEQVQTNQEKTGETADKIETIAKKITDTASSNQKIFDASKLQLEKFHALQENLNNLFDTLTQSSTKVETTATIGEDLYNLTEQLNSLISGFKYQAHAPIEIDQHEMRQHPRVDLSLRVKVVQNRRIMDCFSRDFSMTGIKLRLAQNLDIDVPIEMNIYLPYKDINDYRSQKPLHLMGKIVGHKSPDAANEYYEYGVEFVGLDNAKQEQLRSCFAFFDKAAEFPMAV